MAAMLAPIIVRTAPTPAGIACRALAALLLLAPGLAGCTVPTAVGLGAADAVSLTATKKTLGDHVVSGVTGRDCSIVKFEETGDYCPEEVVVDRSNVYCYRTLADVDCHYIPDPYKNGYTALASPPLASPPPVRKQVERKGWFD